MLYTNYMSTTSLVLLQVRCLHITDEDMTLHYGHVDYNSTDSRVSKAHCLYLNLYDVFAFVTLHCPMKQHACNREAKARPLDALHHPSIMCKAHTFALSSAHTNL